METEVNVKTTEQKPVVKSIKSRKPAKERVPWQRLALSVFGILIILLKWHWGINHLYTLPATSLSAFSSMTTNSDYVIGAIVIFMITGKLVYDWKNSATTAVAENAQSLFEHRESKEEHIITTRTEGGAKAFSDIE